MTEVINCPKCGGQMQVTVELRGKTVRCPHCRAQLAAPGLPEAIPVGPAPMQMPPPPQSYAPRGSNAPVIVIVILVAVFGGIAVLGILAGFLLPALAKAQEAARRAACMNNTRQIGLAMIQWAGDHDDAFPDLVDASGTKVPTAGVLPTEPARSGFVLLLNEGYLTTTKVFICPSSKDRNDDLFPRDYRNTGLQGLQAALGDSNCSYGWDPTKKHSADATCAIIADKPRAFRGREGDAFNSTSFPPVASFNSENHVGDGQNVFYNDGHVKWATTPRPDSGDDPDIYTGAPGYETSPTDAKIIR